MSTTTIIPWLESHLRKFYTHNTPTTYQSLHKWWTSLSLMRFVYQNQTQLWKGPTNTFYQAQKTMKDIWKYMKNMQKTQSHRKIPTNHTNKEKFRYNKNKSLNQISFLIPYNPNTHLRHQRQCFSSHHSTKTSKFKPTISFPITNSLFLISPLL